MITRENLKEILTSLTKEEINNALDTNGDYISLSISVSNSGYVAYISGGDYDETEEQEIVSNGGIYCDKSDFMRLLNETDISY